jgi:hypothetical protein
MMEVMSKYKYVTNILSTFLCKNILEAKFFMLIGNMTLH